MKDFSKKELLKLIEDRGLKIKKVYDVKQIETEPSYKYVVESEEKLKADIEFFNLKLFDFEYMLLSDSEIKYIEKNGFIRIDVKLKYMKN